MFTYIATHLYNNAYLYSHTHLYHKLAKSRQARLLNKAINWFSFLLCLLNLNEATDWIDADTVVGIGLLYLKNNIVSNPTDSEYTVNI